MAGETSAISSVNWAWDYEDQPSSFFVQSPGIQTDAKPPQACPKQLPNIAKFSPPPARWCFGLNSMDFGTKTHGSPVGAKNSYPTPLPPWSILYPIVSALKKISKSRIQWHCDSLWYIMEHTLYFSIYFWFHLELC